ncbi:hypothetical protein ACROYT_G039030 [Oculina patagonica]
MPAATSSSTTLGQCATSQMVETTATTAASSAAVQTSVTVPTLAAAITSAVLPQYESLVQTTATSTTTAVPAQTPVVTQSATSTTSQSSEQSVVLTQTTAPTSTLTTSCSGTSVTATGVLTTTTPSTLSNVVSPTTSSLQSSVNPSASVSTATDHPVSSSVATVSTSSQVPSINTTLSGPEVQISSTTALSTQLVAASSSSDNFSSIEKDTSTYSSLVLNSDHSASKSSALPSSSAPSDSGSTELPVAASSVSTVSSPPPLPNSSATLVPSNFSAVSLATDFVENHDHLLQVESKSETVTVMPGYTVGDEVKALGSSDLNKADDSQSLHIPSPAEITSDVSKTLVLSPLSSQKNEEEVSTSLSVSSLLTVTNSKSESLAEQNLAESTVAHESSPCDPCLTKGPSPCVHLPASQVNDLNSNCVQKNEVTVGSGVSSNEVTSVKDELLHDMKQENSLSADVLPLTEDLISTSLKGNSEVITCESEHKLSQELDIAEQSPVKDKSSPLKNQPSTTTKGEILGKPEEALTDSSDVPMLNHDHEEIDHPKDNEVESIEAPSDLDVFENSDVQEQPSFKSKEPFVSRDEQMEGPTKELQSLENKALNSDQDKTGDEHCSNSKIICPSSDVLPDSQKRHPLLMSKEVSTVVQMEESEKEFKSLENKCVDSSSKKIVVPDTDVLPIGQTEDSLVNECLTVRNDLREGKAEVDVSVESGNKDSDHFAQTSFLIDSLDSGEKVKDNLVMKDVSITSNDNLTIEKSVKCDESKCTEQSDSSTLDIFKSEDICNHDEVALSDDIKSTVSTSTSEDEKTESSAKTSCSVPAEATEFAPSSPHKGDSPCRDEQSSANFEDSNANETRNEVTTKCVDRYSTVVDESSDGSSEAQVSQSVDSKDLSDSSSLKPATVTPETSQNPTEELMEIDVITLSPPQSPSAVTSPLKSVHQTEQPMDVDVTTVSPKQSPGAATTPQTSIDLNASSSSQVSTSTEGTASSMASTSEAAPVLGGAETKTNSESLSSIATTQTCSTTISSAVSTTPSLGITTTDAAKSHFAGNSTPLSSTLPSAAPTAVPTTFPSQSTAQPSGQVKSAVTTMGQSPSTASTTAAAITLATTVTVNTTAAIGTQPAVAVVPSSAALASPRVVATGSQGVVIGGSPVVPLAQTIAAKVSGSPAVLSTAVTRGIAPQKPGIPARPQGQTTQYVPIGPKPILPSPRPPVLSTGVQGSNVVRVNTQPAASGQSGVAPVNSIAALVASIPTSGATIGASQLIRLVTPDGRSITLQGSQLAALAQQASPMGAGVPKTITVQVSGAALQQNPGTSVQKTVGIKTPGAAITVQRPQQQVAQAKPQVAIKPKVETKPLKEEKFPSLEPLIKDPRALLNRRLAKWPLRHSVKSVFALPKHERRKLGRKAGMKEVTGYTYASRAVGVNWPAGIPRPSFKVAWRYRTQSLKTLGGAGLQLRILQSCLKWEEMNVRPPRGNSNTVYTSSGTTTTEITDRKFVSLDGLRCKYLVRKIIRTLSKPVVEPPRPAPTKSKRGRTLRPKIVLQPDDDDETLAPSGPRIMEAWYPEAKLELWEIRQYHERIERERALAREKKEQEEALRRAAELRAAALQRKQQEQQARQQQQHLLKLNKKKVQNAIKTQQRRGVAYKPNVVNPPVTVKQTVAPPLPLGVRRTLPVVRPVVPTKLPGVQTVGLTPQMRTQIVPRTMVSTASTSTPFVQRLQPKPQVTQRVYTPAVPNQISRTAAPSGYTANTVTRPAPVAAPKPAPIRANPMSTSRMKHSSKEQVKQQAVKAKSRKGGGGVPVLHNKKYMTIESRQDLNRIAICRKVLDGILDKIDRSEEAERKKEEKKRAKEENQVLRLERQKANKLGALLQKRKETLKRDMMRKRDLLERDLVLELQQQTGKNKRKHVGSERRTSQSTPEGPKAKKRKVEDERLFCVCKKPYDPTQFYIGCDMCANWFHGACVQVSPETAQSMDEWTCAECTQARRGVEEEELYCLCRKPYDERQFYIGCDKCQDWFHGACVGITAAEADSIEFYTCPRCTESQAQASKQPLTSKDYDSLKRLLRSLQSHKMAWPFLEPVNADEVPEYYDVITDPIDFSMIEERMNSKSYSSLEFFVSDITKIFDNCRYFNQRDSPYYRCAEVLESFFVQKLRAWKTRK